MGSHMLSIHQFSMNLKLVCFSAFICAVTGTVTIAVSTNLATTAAALGLLKLKTAALLALSRQSRSTTDTQVQLFDKVASLEQEKCVRRFLCEVATGLLNAPDYLQQVESMKAENLENLIGSPELPYTESVKYGAKTKNIVKCQNKYVCPSWKRNTHLPWIVWCINKLYEFLNV